MALLRGPEGCAWDREQTLESIQPHTLEEVYEVFDAIRRSDWPGLQDELGDLLLQVLFYAQIAHDDGRFDIAAVVCSLGAKLVRRHPHVFGEALASTPEEVVSTWEKVKQQERANAKGREDGLLSGISSAMPAFTEARKLGKAAASVGFDWTDTQGVLAKVNEEVHELSAELADPDQRSHQRVEEEFGDLLFVLSSLARHAKVDPEQALRKANAKFRRRFMSMEALAMQRPLIEHTPDELEALWQRAKDEEQPH